MTYAPRIADLAEAFDTTAIQRALESAYARGFQDGKDAFKAAILNMDAPPLGEKVTESSAAEPDDDDGKRAPRGLTRRTITAILKQKGGMRMQELLRAAAATDKRILMKTVYNELMREKGRLYREQNDIWSLIGDNPVEAANTAVAGPPEADWAFGDYFPPEPQGDQPV